MLNQAQRDLILDNIESEIGYHEVMRVKGILAEIAKECSSLQEFYIKESEYLETIYGHFLKGMYIGRMKRKEVVKEMLGVINRMDGVKQTEVYNLLSNSVHNSYTSLELLEIFEEIVKDGVVIELKCNIPHPLKTEEVSLFFPKGTKFIINNDIDIIGNK